MDEVQEGKKRPHGPFDQRMVVWVILYFAVVFLGAALVAPWMYKTAQNLAAVFPFLSDLSNQPFHRYVSRLLIVLGIASLWPLLRASKMNNRACIGLGSAPGAWVQFGNGLAVGFGSLAFAGVLAIMFGARTFESRSAVSVAEHLTNAALAAMTVSVLEEVLFRGTLFGCLRKAMHWGTALLISSGIYSVVHFFHRPSEPEMVYWNSGLVTLREMLGGLLDGRDLMPGFLNLALAGVILGLAYQRLGTLHFSIGLHAGWIFWLKWYGLATKGTSDSNLALWGSRKLIDGWISSVVLVLVLVVVLWKVRPNSPGTRRM